METQPQYYPYPPANNNKKRYILLGAGVLAFLGLAGFGWWYYKRNRKTAFDELEDDTVTTTAPASNYVPAPIESGFPLKQGSKGSLVKQLQTALNTYFGQSLKVDGDWGPKTTAALASKGLATVIDAATFAKITAGTTSSPGSEPSSPSSGTNPHSETAAMLVLAKKNIDYNKAILALQRIQNVTDYTAANTFFKLVKFGGVSYTIVNAMLATFIDGKQKDTIKKEFLRIGLKYDGSKWSLAGLSSPARNLQTNSETTIWDSNNNALDVPAYTILGKEISASAGITKFRTLDGRILFVASKNIQYA